MVGDTLTGDGSGRFLLSLLCHTTLRIENYFLQYFFQHHAHLIVLSYFHVLLEDFTSIRRIDISIYFFHHSQHKAYEGIYWKNPNI